MIRYTDRPRSYQQEVLALDSIYHFLTNYERILLHLSHNTNAQELTPKIKAFIQWVFETRWETPYMKYPEFHKDLLHYEDHRGQLIPVEEYSKYHIAITEQILELKIKFNLKTK